MEAKSKEVITKPIWCGKKIEKKEEGRRQAENGVKTSSHT